MNLSTVDVSNPVIESRFRPVPFWSWNDELEVPELIRQIHVMHHSGIGGFFMHARGGLRTPYMGKKWMECVSACVREAAALGMKSYLYDENGWPSGFGAGTVNGLGIAYQQKDLFFDKADSLPQDENSVPVAFYDSNFCLTDSQDKAVWCVWFTANPFYVDNMDPMVTGTFIEKIHETYWRELPEDVKESLSGIFTDEPQLSRGGCPWSMILPDEYRKRYAEELLPLLPDLFRDTPRSSVTRTRYYRLCGELFRENYILKIGDWCRRHNWLLTGHHVLEERSNWQVYSSGSIMRQYEGYDIPGNDHLGRYSSYVVSDVQVVSIAAQYGKKQIMTETYGCSGWNFNMQGKKWLYQQQMVHGINLLCQHLIGYSLHGLRKRDYPASLFEQHPMWKHIKTLHDSFSRVGRMLSCGKIECSTLILHTVSTAWRDAVGGRGTSELVLYCNRAFEELAVALDKKGYPFHFGDEPTLDEIAKVEGNKLQVGKMSYSCVVIPPLANLSEKVMKLLKEFAASGGTIFNAGCNPGRALTLSGHSMPEEDFAFLAALPRWHSTDELILQLTQKGYAHLECRTFEGGQGRVRGTWRHFPERNERWYFIADFASIPEKKAQDDIALHQYHQTPCESAPLSLEITLAAPADLVEVIDQASGALLRSVDFAEKEGKPCFMTTLPPNGSLLLRTVNKSELPALDITRQWQIRELRNVLTLDKVRYKLPGEKDFSPATDTLAVFNRLLAMPDTDVILRYEFECTHDLDPADADFALALEADEKAVFLLNGQAVKPVFEGFFIDRSIRVLRLPAEFLKKGLNTFDICTFFRQRKEIRLSLEKAKHFESEANKLFFDSEVESVYLLGNFKTVFEGTRTFESPKCYFYEGRFKAGKAPETVDISSFLEGGLSFFSGELRLEKKIVLTAGQARNFRKLRLAPFRADSMEITVNGTRLPLIYDAPYEVQTAGLLKAGENLIEITVAVSPRNTLGPLHTGTVEPEYVGPGSFLMEPDILGRTGGNPTAAYGFIEPGTEYCKLC